MTGPTVRLLPLPACASVSQRPGGCIEGGAVLGFLFCLIIPHVPDRRRVKKLTPEGAYRGVCRRCGGRIVRIKRDHWVRDWLWRFRQP